MNLSDKLFKEIYLTLLKDCRRLKKKKYSRAQITQQLEGNLKAAMLSEEEWDQWWVQRLPPNISKPTYEATPLSHLNKNGAAILGEIIPVVVNSCLGQQEEELDEEENTSNIIVFNIDNYCAYCRPQPSNDIFIAPVTVVSVSHCDNGQPAKDVDGDALKVLLLIAIVFVVAIITLVALYYLLSQALDGMERVIHHEGWVQALVILSSMVAGAAAGALFDVYVASLALAPIALFFGFSNPIGFIIVGAICTAIITAALTGLVVDFIQDSALTSLYSGALDSADPHRYSLSKKEENALIEQGINPIAVKCAIIELRMQLPESGLSSVLTRFFTDDGRREQKIIESIRKLKGGQPLEPHQTKLKSITLLDGRVIDLTLDAAKAPAMVMDPLEQSAPFNQDTDTGCYPPDAACGF